LNLPADIKEEYPFKGEFLEIEGGWRLHYLDEGEGSRPPILMLHGNPTWSFFYRKLILALREKDRCIAPDHLGCGLSDKPPHGSFPYDLSAHIGNLRTLLDRLGIDKVRLVVHDWGGAIGLGAFCDVPERVERLVILNTAAFLSPRVPKRILLCRLPFVGAFLVRGLNAFAGLAARMAVVKPLPEAVRKGFLYPYCSWANRVAVWRFVRDIPHEANHPTRLLVADIEGKLTRFEDTPKLACWGLRDFCFSEHFLDQWRGRFSDLSVQTLPNAGHYLLEDASDECIPRIVAFLRDA
jgi:cis-3-alkyl-4-acyloxetan-2-one decarboxylase